MAPPRRAAARAAAATTAPSPRMPPVRLLDLPTDLLVFLDLDFLHVFKKECPHARAWRARDRCQQASQIQHTGGVPARGGHSLPRHSIASITPVRRHEPPCCVRYFDTSVATSLAAPQREEPTRTVRPHTEVADACASCAARILATSSRVKCSTVAMAGKSA